MLDLISALFAFSTSLVAILKMTWFHRAYNAMERIGLGLIAGPALMLGLSLLEGPDSPFRLWAFTIFMGGNLAYIVGRFIRAYKHWVANEAQKQRAVEYFERKEAR